MFAFSTSWNAWRHSSAAGLVNEVRDLGFSRLELGFSLPLHLYEEMKQEVAAGRISIASLHDYCPSLNTQSLSPGRRRDCLLSSRDERERAAAVSAAVRTLQAAREVNAPAVIIHSGQVPLLFSSRKIFSRMELRGDISDPSPRRKLGRIVARREKRKSRYLAQTIKSLKEIEVQAAACGVKLGIENRYFPEEIPSLEEIGVILAEINSPWVGYWHDVGHAQVKENLGLENHEEYLRGYSGRMIGMHIHDVRGLSDHRAPLTGDFDFRRLKKYLRDDLIKVIEVHPLATAEEIKRALVFLESNFS